MCLSENVGYISIRVRPNAKGFRREAERQIESETNGLEGNVGLRARGDRLRSDARRNLEEATRGLEGTIPVKYKVDRRDLEEAQKNLQKLREEADRAGKDGGLGKALDRANGVRDLADNVDRARRNLDKMRESANASGRALAEAQKRENDLLVEKNRLQSVGGREAAKAAKAYDDQQKAVATLVEKSTKAQAVATENEKRFAEQRRELLKAALADKADYATGDERLDLQIQAEYDRAYDVARSHAARLKAVELERSRVKKLVAKARAEELTAETEDTLRRLALYRDALTKEAELAREELAAKGEFAKLNDDQFRKFMERERARLREREQVLADHVALERHAARQVLQAKDNERIALEEAELAKLATLSRSNTQLKSLAKERQKLYNDLFSVDVEALYRRGVEAMGSKNGDLRKLFERDVADAALDDEALARLRQRLRIARDAIETEFSRINLDLKVDPSVKEMRYRLAAEKLDYLARDRDVNLVVNIREKVTSVSKKSVSSMVGGNVYREGAEAFEKLVTNLDEATIAWGSLATKVGAGTAVLSGASSTAFGLYGNLTKVVGAANLAPAAFTALAATFIANKAAWEDFSNAVGGDDEALAKLPARARESAVAMRGFYSEIRKPAQEAFWSKFGNDFDKMNTQLRHVLPGGIKGVATELAGLEAGFARAIGNAAKRGDLSDELSKVALMLRNSSKGAEQFGETLNILSRTGSAFLPQFGQWLTEISTGFHQWAAQAEKSGRLSVLMRDGVNAVRDLGGVLGQTAGMLNDFAEIADQANAVDLADLRHGLEGARSILQDPVFQKRLATIFEGGQQGVAQMASGFADLGRAIGENADRVKQLEINAGAVVGNVGQIGAEFLRTRSFLDGILNLVKGVEQFTSNTGPAWRSIADAIGSTGGALGAMASDSIPGFNAAVRTASRIVTTLMGDVEKISPAVGRIAANFFELSNGPLSLALEITDGLLTAFSKLPAPVQDTVAALGLAVAAKRQFAIVAGQAAASEEQARQRAEVAAQRSIATEERRAAVVRAAAGSTSASYARMGAAATAALTETEAASSRTTGSTRAVGQACDTVRAKAVGMGAALTGALREAGTQATITAGKVQAVGGTSAMAGTAAAASGFRSLGESAKGAAVGGVGLLAKGASGLLTLLGGPVGLVIGGAALLMGEFAQKNQEAEQRTRDLKNSLSELGTTTSQTAKVLSEQMKETDSFLFFKGAATDEKIRALRDMGTSFEDMSKKVVAGSRQSSAELEAYAAQQDRVAEAHRRVSQHGDTTIVTLDDVGKAAEKNAQSAREMAQGARKAEEEIARLTEEHVRASIAAEKHSANGTLLSDSFLKMSDAATSTSDRMSLVAQALSVLDSGVVKSQASDYAKVQTLESMTRAFEQVAQGANGTVAPLIAADGTIKNLKGSGGQLYASLTEWNGKLREQAAIVYDNAIKAGKTPEEAARASAQVYSIIDNNMSKLAESLGLTGIEFQKLRDKYIDQQWEIEASLGADSTAFNIAMDAARDKGHELTQKEWKAFLSANKEQFDAAYEAVKSSGKDWSASFYDAYLAANPDPATRSIEGAKDFALKFANGDYRAVLGAMDTDAKIKLENLYKRGSDWSDSEWEAQLKALDQSEPVVAAYVRAMRAATKEPYSAVMKTIVENMGDVTKARQMLEAFPKITETQLKATDGISPEAIKAIATLRGIPPQKVIEMLSNDKDPEARNRIKRELDGLDPQKLIDIYVKDMSPGERKMVQEDLRGMPPEKIIDVVTKDLTPEQRRAALDELAQFRPEVNTNINTTDTGRNTRQTAMMDHDGLDGRQSNTNVTTTDSGTEARARAKLEQDVLNGMTAFTSVLTGDQGAVVRQSAKAQLDAMNGYTAAAAITASDLTGHAQASARSGLGAVVGAAYIATLTARDATAPGRGQAAGALGQTVGSVYQAAVTARDATAGGRGQAEGALRSTTNRDWAAGIRVFWGGIPAPPPLPSLVQFIDVFRRNRNADGNVYAPAPLKAYAAGGVEDHSATISYASPQTPVRVWAEPETGGEAYIPLSATKRSRSTAILNTVADRFGYDLHQRGRASAGSGSSGDVSSAPGGPVVNITNNYPQAEPTSRTLQRALQYAAVPGL